MYEIGFHSQDFLNVLQNGRENLQKKLGLTPNLIRLKEWMQKMLQTVHIMWINFWNYRKIASDFELCDLDTIRIKLVSLYYFILFNCARYYEPKFGNSNLFFNFCVFSQQLIEIMKSNGILINLISFIVCVWRHHHHLKTFLLLCQINFVAMQYSKLLLIQPKINKNFSWTRILISLNILIKRTIFPLWSFSGVMQATTMGGAKLDKRYSPSFRDDSSRKQSAPKRKRDEVLRLVYIFG